MGESFLFAFFMDKSKDERARGVTIACTTREFFTESYHYTIIDAPGHRDFIKNMISGASQADVALLMVPSNKGGFETSIAKGNHKKGEVQGQTRQHARLCHLLGIEQVICGINKMDDKSVNWSQDRYKEIKGEVDKMLTKIGYKKEKVKGHTLVDALEKVVKPPKRNDKKVFRMPVSGVYKIKGVGDVVTGRVEQGKITAGVNVRFYPTGCTGNIFSIEMHHKNVETAHCGDNVGLNVKKLPKENMPHTGDVMAINDLKVDPEPPRACKEFTALVFVQDHPGKLSCGKMEKDKKSGAMVCKGGFTPSIHIRTAKAPCQMTSINWKMGKSTSNAKVEGVPYIEAGDQAEVVFKPRTPIVVQPFDECKPLGRIAAMDSNSLIMLGKVTKVTYVDPK